MSIEFPYRATGVLLKFKNVGIIISHTGIALWILLNINKEDEIVMVEGRYDGFEGMLLSHWTIERKAMIGAESLA